MAAVMSSQYTASPLSTAPSSSTTTRTSSLRGRERPQPTQQYPTLSSVIRYHHLGAAFNDPHPPDVNQMASGSDSEQRAMQALLTQSTSTPTPTPTARLRPCKKGDERAVKLERVTKSMAMLKANPPLFTLTNLLSSLDSDSGSCLPIHRLISDIKHLPNYLLQTPIVRQPRGRIKTSKLMSILAEVQSEMYAEDDVPFRVAFGFSTRGDGVCMHGDNFLSSSTPFVAHSLASDELYPPVNPNVNGTYTKMSELAVIPRRRETWNFPQSNAYYTMMLRGSSKEMSNEPTIIPVDQTGPLFASSATSEPQRAKELQRREWKRGQKTVRADSKDNDDIDMLLSV